MADDDNIYGTGGHKGGKNSFGGSRRDRVSDTDLEAGGSANSREYDRIYNPQSENEYSNLPENQTQLYLRRMEEDRQRQLGGMSPTLQSAIRRVQYWPNVGRFILPRDLSKSFQAHARLVKFGDQADIHFDPDTYQYFDRIIAESAKRPDLFDPTHPEYAKHAELRDNLAVIRNDVMGIYMNDGSFDPGDEKFLPLLCGVAQAIGEGIAANKGAMNGWRATLNLKLMEVEGEGAAHVYKFLLKHQTSGSILGRMQAFFLRLLGQDDRQWNLPPLEQTPFSAENLYAPAPKDELCHCPPEVLQAQCAGIVADQYAKAKRFNDVASLSLDERNEALLHGHTILEWLKNIKFSDKSMTEWIETSTEGEVREKTEIISKAILMFDMLVDAIRQHDPAQVTPAMEEAEHARKCLQHSLQLMAKLEKPVSLADTMQISSGASEQPERWGELKDQTVDRLMQTLTGGMEDAVSALDQQQESLDRQQEEQAQATNDIQMQGQAQRRKRKRRQMRSGAGGGAQRKTDEKLRADDRVAGQGIHAPKGGAAPARGTRTVVREAAPVVQPVAQAAAPVVNAALDPVLRDLGKTLMQYNQEGKEAADKLAQQAADMPPKPPLDQNFADRQNEQRGKDDGKKRPRI